MMLDKAMGKILVLKYLLCYRHISILITLKQLKTEVQKNQRPTILFSCSYLVESLVHTWEEPEFIYAILFFFLLKNTYNNLIKYTWAYA